MAFQPQNPFEFVEQLLARAAQTVSGGFGAGLRAREERADQLRREGSEREEQLRREAREDAQIAERHAREDERFTAQAASAYALQQIPILQQLAAQIGDDDPELVSALGGLADELQRGALAEPQDVAAMVGRARALLARRSERVIPFDFPEGVEPEPGFPTSITREEVTEREFTPQELVTYAMGRAGELERIRALSAAEQEQLLKFQFEEFKNSLAMARDRAGSDYEFGQNLVSSARETLAQVQALSHMMSPEMRAQYEPQIVALQALATSTPQAAYELYQQGMLQQEDIFLGLAQVSGLTTELTRRQERILNRWDDFVGRIQDDREKVDQDAAMAALAEVEHYLPPYMVDPTELNMVRQYLGVPTALGSAREYVQDPDRMAAGLSIYVSQGHSGEFKIDFDALRERNPALYEAYWAAPGEADNALRALFMRRSVADMDYAASISDAARTVLETGVGYDQLPNEAKVEVKRALGNAGAGDAWTRDELARRAELAGLAAQATHRIAIANAEMADLQLPAKLVEWAQDGNYGALIAYQLQDPARAEDEDLTTLINQAREIHLANLDIVRYDKRTREATSREALRKAALGEALNGLEKAALQAQLELDARQAIRDMGMLDLRTNADVANLLAGIAEVVPEAWWDEASLPEPISAAVERMGLMPALRAISRSGEYALGSDLRDDVRDFVLNLAESIPLNETDHNLMLEAADREMMKAGFPDAVRAGFTMFLEASWRMLADRERRAQEGLDIQWSNNELGWANHWLRVRELARQNQIDDAKALIGFVDGLVDNERQGITAEHAALVAMGCADQQSMVFGGTTQLKPEATIIGGEGQGLSCAAPVQRFHDRLDRFKANEAWHTQLVGSAGEILGTPRPAEAAEPLTGWERLVPAPFTTTSFGNEGTWDTQHSAARLREKPASELLPMAASLAYAISAEEFGRFTSVNVRALYARVMGELYNRYGKDQADHYVTTIVGNR